MNEERAGGRRRTFRWPKEARELVRIHLNVPREQLRERNPDDVRLLVTRLAEVSGNPRDTLIAVQPLPEVAIAMRRSPGSIRSMLYRLGASARMGQDWFTKYTLAEALHIRADEVQRWISLGWLKCRVVHTGKLQREIIDADAFSEFCKTHSRDIVGRRLNIDRLDFVKDFVFPPSHAELLPVRESKKERAAYEEQMGRPPHSEIDDEQYDEGLATSA